MISFNICTTKMCKYVNSFVQWCIKLQKKRENKWSPAGKEVRNRAAWKHNTTIYMFKTTLKALFLHPVRSSPWQSGRELFINTTLNTLHWVNCTWLRADTLHVVPERNICVLAIL